MERRLAAVLIADVVGYSHLSQIDEEGTRARFQSDLREVFEPKFVEHHGRLVKTMGDGVLVDFHSVVDAVRCAIEIQQHRCHPACRDVEFAIQLDLSGWNRDAGTAARGRGGKRLVPRQFPAILG